MDIYISSLIIKYSDLKPTWIYIAHPWSSNIQILNQQHGYIYLILDHKMFSRNRTCHSKDRGRRVTLYYVYYSLNIIINIIINIINQSVIIFNNKIYQRGGNCFPIWIHFGLMSSFFEESEWYFAYGHHLWEFPVISGK